MEILLGALIFSALSGHVVEVSGFVGTSASFCQQKKPLTPLLFFERSRAVLLGHPLSRPTFSEYNELKDDADTTAVKIFEDVDELPDDFDDDDDTEILEQERERVELKQAAADTSRPSKSEHASSSIQYAALEPGTVLQIQVGDINLARKAWKKRRRSGSPLLVPCSILSVDRTSTIRHNLIYLLEKFGAAPSNNKNSGIRISLSSLHQRYRSHLKSSLQKHATQLGFTTAQALIEDLFNGLAQETYGVQLVTDSDGSQWLSALISRHRAQKRANDAAILQFADDDSSDHDALLHTGFVRNKNPNPESGENFYKLMPLSAALRVSQKEDVESGNIQNGSLHPAVVFDYDPAGDAGAPLLTLSFNPSSNGVRDRLKIIPKNQQLQQQQQVTIRNPKYKLKELHMGDGPLRGKVVRLQKEGALVDCRVGRPLHKSNGENADVEMTQVLGFLRFDDTIADDAQEYEKKRPSKKGPRNQAQIENADINWGDFRSKTRSAKEDEDEEDEIVMDDFEDEFENSEDITHLFKIASDGSLVYTDDATGETHVLSMEDDDMDEEDASLGEDMEEEKTVLKFPDEEDVDEEENGPVIFQNPQTPTKNKQNRFGKTKRLRVGDELDVFVKSVSRQSSRLEFTMNSEVQGKKAMDVKRQNEVGKKLARLEKQLGGLDRIQAMQGMEMDGVVKATSHTGNWLYVQPQNDSGLPVGVATFSEEDREQLKQGDAVVIRLEGIDSTRGQLALKVLHKKLSP